jgi:hypothetical protein
MSSPDIVGSNATRGMDACLRLFSLCCPVCLAALRWADLPSKESYELSIRFKFQNYFSI